MKWLLFWSLFTPWNAHASSTHHALDLATLTERSERIIQGEVVAVQPKEARDGIRTTYTVVVYDTLLGLPLEEVTVTLPGGRMGDIVQRVSGVPLYKEGDEVVLFLTGENRPILRGLFTVEAHRLQDPLPDRAADFPETIEELREQILPRP